MIPVLNLLLALVPVLVVVGILYKWRLSGTSALYAVARMLAQLLLVGYVLAYIFESDEPWIVLLVLAIMPLVASWIAMRPVRERPARLYWRVLVSIALGGVTTLLLVTQGVLALEPWFLPRYTVPLGGMIFANAMNAVSLAAERFESELYGGADYETARRTALNAALIPLTNSLLAVGLVSLPGMMTGQILSGVSPLVAVRYQIMVMCMIFGSAGISAACYLVLAKSKFASPDRG